MYWSRRATIDVPAPASGTVLELRTAVGAPTSGRHKRAPGPYAILSVATQWTKGVPHADLSIVRVARERGVTPALIHHYLGG